MEPKQVGKYRIVDEDRPGRDGRGLPRPRPVLDRDVAIKVVSGKLSADEKSAPALPPGGAGRGQLTHPNIITVHDFGEEQGVAYMAMELLEGSRPARR